MTTLSVSGLVKAREALDRANSEMDDAWAINALECIRLGSRIDNAWARWREACVNATVRRELLVALSPAIVAREDHTLWGIKALPTKPAGDIALRAFAADHRKNGSTSTRHALWGPGWLVPELESRGLIRVLSCEFWTLSRAHAETATALWEPLKHCSAYTVLGDAVNAANALLNS